MSFDMHLTEEQIDDVVLGETTAKITEHLAACGACREQVIGLRLPIESFAAVTLAWSQRQSATMPPQPVEMSSSPWTHKLNWALAAMVLLVVGFMLPMATRETPGGSNLSAKDTAQPVAVAETHAAQVPEPKMRMVAARVSDDEVARDNQMLEAIDDELDASVQSPADAFALVSSGSRAGGGHGRNAPAPNWD